MPILKIKCRFLTIFTQIFGLFCFEVRNVSLRNAKMKHDMVK